MRIDTRRMADRIPILAVILLLTPLAWAQGRADGYFNVESPQVHPIDVLRIADHDYLLVTNTADNSVELWDTDEVSPGKPRFIRRIPVGIEPVSVRGFAEDGIFGALVANFLSDSITMILFAAPAGNGDPTVTYVSTKQTIDEPLDIALQWGPAPYLIASHMTLDALSGADSALNPIPGFERFAASASAGADIDNDGMVDEIALKEPRTVLKHCDKLFALGTKGGNTIHYDMDLYIRDDATGATTALGGLGSTNLNMAFDAHDNLWVVGGEAKNELRGEATVAMAATGFVESRVYVVIGACGDSPTVLSRDVNEYLPPGSGSDPVPAPLDAPLAQLTDVTVFELDGEKPKVFFTAFSSDALGVLVPDLTTNPLSWPRRKISLAAQGRYRAPRGLALKLKGSRSGDAGHRLYVLNRNEESITVVDPISERPLGTVPLDRQLTPSHITDGRTFIYSAEHSRSGFVSCSSCHTDSRTDGLAWDLSDGVAVSVPRALTPDPTLVLTWEADKEDMVTQSLQGLLNWDVEPGSMAFVTNGPYHWRGDRADLPAFGGAFPNLLLGPELSTRQLDQMEDFVNAVSYPPNPKQPKSRIYSGDIGDPGDDGNVAGGPSGDASGSGAQRGVKLFHIHTFERCSGCHALPEGSDNILTENIAGRRAHPVMLDPSTQPPSTPQLIESAALRMLFQREARLDIDGSSRPEASPITGWEGVFHTGIVNAASVTQLDFNGVGSVNSFVENFFTTPAANCGGQGATCGMCNISGVNRCGNIDSVQQYMHEFDTGTGPMVGQTVGVTSLNMNDPALLAEIAAAEAQAELANAGLAVHVWNQGSFDAYYYDVTAPNVTCSGSTLPCRYRDANGSLTSRDKLVGSTQGFDTRAFFSVPLGTERRQGHPAGKPGALGGSPTNVQLQPMPTNSANAIVPAFPWSFGAFFTLEQTLLVYENALRFNPVSGFSPGVCPSVADLRAFVPRRLAVSGDGIENGAQLTLWVQNDPTAGAPNITLGPTDPAQVEMTPLRVPLFPTERFDGGGRRIWETAIELEPLYYYRLMAGRPDQTLKPGVMVGLGDKDDLRSFTFAEMGTPGFFDPTSWNRHFVQVANAGANPVDFGWQRLSVVSPPGCP